mgnify:CR=1 FL=1
MKLRTVGFIVLIIGLLITFNIFPVTLSAYDNRIGTYLKVSWPKEVKRGDQLVINATLLTLTRIPVSNKPLHLKIDGNDIDTKYTDEHGKVTFQVDTWNLALGKHSFKVRFNGDEKYIYCWVGGYFKVVQRTPELNIDQITSITSEINWLGVVISIIGLLMIFGGGKREN